MTQSQHDEAGSEGDAGQHDEEFDGAPASGPVPPQGPQQGGPGQYGVPQPGAFGPPSGGYGGAPGHYGPPPQGPPPQGLPPQGLPPQGLPPQGPPPGMFGGVPPMPPHQPPPPMTPKGFFGALFDYSFSNSVTSRVVKWVYMLITVLTVAWYVFATISVFSIGGDAGVILGVFFLLVIGPILALLNLVVWRILLEFFRAVVAMAEDIRHIRHARLLG